MSPLGLGVVLYIALYLPAALYSSGTVFLAVMTLIHHQGAASCMSQFTSYMQMWFKTSMTFVQVTWWAMLQGFTGHLMWDEAQPREDLCTFTFMYH